MKKSLLTISAVVLLLTTNEIARAQVSPVATGGKASGSGGTSTYSVGQSTYINTTTATGSITQGVQQPYEIQTTLGTDKNSIELSFVAYPNPTVGNLTLSVGDFDFSNASYQLFDLTGRLLLQKIIAASTCSIAMESYPQATYLMKIFKNGKTIKTFKIIKKL